jgi:Flp pilus assembly pilin Flp
MFWRDERGQDIVEYAMMLVIVLLLSGVTVKLVGANVKQIFHQADLGDTVHRPSNQTAEIVQHCEDAVRDKIDGGLRTDFPTPSPELRVRKVDANDFRVESFVETRSADGSVARIEYSCNARCTQADGCSVVTELRR